MNDLLPEAYATVREAAKRVLGMEHYRVQIIGGIILHQGRIAEMRTGEGKTLVCTLPAYLNALEEKGVLVVTVNDYLAKRDAEWMGQVHNFLGLSVGIVLHDMKDDERRAAYASDITYVTNNELGFDYLRDNMAIYKEQLVLRDLHYCIIDEVDSVLIDEARTPLIISGMGDKSTKFYNVADNFVKTLINEKDFNVTRNNAYNYNINLNLADASDKRITIEKIPLEGIAAEANCYILNPNSEHELLVPVKRVNAFWGTEEGGFKTDHMLNDGNNQGKVTKWVARIITKDSSKELLRFTTQQGSSANDYIGIKPTGNEGNVLIGIYDATAGEPAQDAKPLWSWHIWITDYNPGGDINGIIPAISQNPGKADVTGGAIYRFGGIDNNQTKDGSTQAMMDRNLGALSATPTDGAKTIGMYYQCGRKDPIMTDWSQITKLGTSSLGGDVYSIHIKTAKGPVSKETAVKNPDTYFLGDADHFTYKDWLIEGSGSTELWYKKSDEKTKTLYDPCPAGWRVPYKMNTYGEINGEDVDNGIYLCPNSSIKIFYPFGGHLNAITGQYPGGSLFEYKTAQNGWLGSYPDNPNNAYSYHIFSAALVDEYDGPFYPIMPNNADGRYLGYSVRCVKE